MIYAAICAIFLFAIFWFCWLFFYLFVRISLALTFTITYFMLWDDTKRKAICPNGFLSALFCMD